MLYIAFLYCIAVASPAPLPPQKKKMIKRNVFFFLMFFFFFYFRFRFFDKIHLLESSNLEKVEGFVLKKLLTYFKMLVVSHPLHCVDSCFFVFYLISSSGILFWFQPLTLTPQKKHIFKFLLDPAPPPPRTQKN